jgi:hypothetical protein
MVAYERQQNKKSSAGETRRTVSENAEISRDTRFAIGSEDKEQQVL